MGGGWGSEMDGLWCLGGLGFTLDSDSVAWCRGLDGW